MEPDTSKSADALKGTKGIRRVVNAFGYSIAGLRAAYDNEAAFRQLLWLNIVLLTTAAWLDVTAIERAILMLTPLLCLVIELLNTAIENVVDRVSMAIHPLSKNAKDMGSAAQLIGLLMVTVTWLTILSDRL